MDKLVNQALNEIGRALLGKEQQIKMALCCLIAGGHLLIEDLPGMGKTTLSQAIAKVVGLQYNRIQFTSDLLPADILGVSIFNKNEGQFHFHPGPIFTQILLADEINRTTPKTQSALLEAMAEGQVTVEGKTRPLGNPFFVIATQNPITQAGTFPLPESQLDRFLMRIELGYPDPAAERKLFQGVDSQTILADLQPCISSEALFELQADVESVKVSESLLDYLQRLVAHTRNAVEFDFGLSPRGALALLRCAKAWALIDARLHVIPEDIQAMLPAVAGHRLNASAEFDGDGSSLINRLLTDVKVIV